MAERMTSIWVHAACCIVHAERDTYEFIRIEQEWIKKKCSLVVERTRRTNKERQLVLISMYPSSASPAVVTVENNARTGHSTTCRQVDIDKIAATTTATNEWMCPAISISVVYAMRCVIKSCNRLQFRNSPAFYIKLFSTSLFMICSSHRLSVVAAGHWRQGCVRRNVCIAENSRW